MSSCTLYAPLQPAGTGIGHSRCSGGSLIIEVSGPSAAGKTTLARELASELISKRHCVELTASARPAEGAAPARRPKPIRAAAMRASKALHLLPSIAPFARSQGVAPLLLALFPSERRLWSIRNRRYLSELDERWSRARSSDRVVIFDQGYHSALAMLSAFQQRIDRDALVRGLDLIPRPDLLIRLSAPPSVLQTRLEERLGAQGMLERMFELDVATTLRQVDAFRMIDELMVERGERGIELSYSDRTDTDRAVESVIRHVAVHQSGDSS